MDRMSFQLYHNLDENKIGPNCRRCGREETLVSTKVSDALILFDLSSEEDLDKMMITGTDERCEHILQYTDDDTELMFYICIKCFEKDCVIWTEE